jgi:site-specific DNA-methyltransferase (adenine-specific)
MRVERIGDATLYLGDCLEVLPTLPSVDVVITDPPFPDVDKGFPMTSINRLDAIPCRQFVFWSATCDFPLSWTAIHIWHKPNVPASNYERIFERNGQRISKVYREAAILPNYVQYAAECVPHPTQKPLKLIRRLVDKAPGLVLDPFMGSGTAGVACAEAGRAFIGCEIEPAFFDIACERIENVYRQERLFA